MNQISEIKATLSFPKIDQVGVVVKDLEKTIAYYTSVLGLGPFRQMDPTFTNVTLRGKPVEFKGKFAFAKMGAVSLELIQVVKGATIYDEFLATKGEGLHHLGCYVSDLDAEVKKCREAGIEVLQSGNAGSSKFAYMDTEKIGGIILEYIQRGTM